MGSRVRHLDFDALLRRMHRTVAIDQNGLHDVRVRVEHESLHVDSTLIEMSGATIVRGSNVANQNVLLHVVHPPHLALHIPLRGSAAPYVPATNVALPTSAGAAALVLIPTHHSTVALREGERNEVLRINLT